MTDNIKVAIKVRPLLDQEHLGSQWQIKGNTLTPTGNRFREPFCFDYVFNADTTNLDVYKTVVRPITESALTGFNGTVFAYGQTASGKTHTLFGSKECLGIIELAIDHIFNSLEKYPDREFLLRASFIEIYQEKVFDLLDDSKHRPNIQIREDVNGTISLPVLEEVASTPNSLLNIMKKGDNNRKIGVTNMNERSSRSHTIFRIIIESRNHNDPNGTIQVAHLNFVDLAGSERLTTTGLSGERLKETNHINLSLLSLSRVIKQLSESNCQNQFVNYRDSKLTRILQSSLGGNAKTCIICNITSAFLEETQSTLSFAARAKAVVNKPKLNEILSDAALISKYLKEIHKLKEELRKAQNVNMNLQSNEKKVTETNQKLREQIALLENSFLRADKNYAYLNNSECELEPKTWCLFSGNTPQKGLLNELTTLKLKPFFGPSNASTINIESSVDDISLKNFDLELMKTKTNMKDVEENGENLLLDVHYELETQNINEEIENLKEFHTEEINILLSENEKCFAEMCAVKQENDKLKLELIKLRNSDSPNKLDVDDIAFGSKGNFKLLNQSFKSLEQQIINQIEILEYNESDYSYDIYSEMIKFLKNHLKEVKLNYYPCYLALKQLSLLKREMRQRLPNILETECMPFNEDDQFELKEIFASIKTLLRQLTEHLVTSEWNLEQKEENISMFKNEIEKANCTINKLSEKMKLLDSYSGSKHQEIIKIKTKRSPLKNEDVEDIENTLIEKRKSNIQLKRRKLREVLQDSNRNIIVENGSPICEKIVCENLKNTFMSDLEKHQQKSMKSELQNAFHKSKYSEKNALLLETYKKEHDEFKPFTNENERLASNYNLSKLETLQNQFKKLQCEKIGDEKSDFYELQNLKEQINTMIQGSDEQNIRSKELSQQMEEKNLHSSTENKELQIALKTLSDQIENKSKLFLSLSSEFKNLNERHNLCKKINYGLNNLQNDLKKQLKCCETENEHLRHQITNLQQQIDNRKLREKLLLSDIDNLKQDHKKYSKIQLNLINEITLLKEKLKFLAMENENLKKNLNLCHKEKFEVAEMNRSFTIEYKKLSQKAETVSKGKSYLMNQVIQLNKKLNIISFEVIKKQNFITHLEKQIKEKNIHYLAVISENQKLAEELNGLSFKLSQKNNENKKVYYNDFKNIKSQHDALKSKINTLLRDNRNKISQIESLNIQINYLLKRLEEFENSTEPNANIIKNQNDYYELLTRQLKGDKKTKYVEAKDLKFEISALKDELEHYKEPKNSILVDNGVQKYSKAAVNYKETLH